ncbi:hypothetical protein FHG87_010962 [Trinorchestia longiramus]|nr:hypothetical protein FHG87_010962 [Trinorchestia longiramus]
MRLVVVGGQREEMPSPGKKYDVNADYGPDAKIKHAWCGYRVVIILGLVISVMVYTIGAILSGVAYRTYDMGGMSSTALIHGAFIHLIDAFIHLSAAFIPLPAVFIPLKDIFIHLSTASSPHLYHHPPPRSIHLLICCLHPPPYSHHSHSYCPHPPPCYLLSNFRFLNRNRYSIPLCSLFFHQHDLFLYH